MKDLKAAQAASDGLHGGELGLKVEFIPESGGNKGSVGAGKDSKPVIIKKTVISPTTGEKTVLSTTMAGGGEAVSSPASIPLPKPKGPGEAGASIPGSSPTKAKAASPDKAASLASVEFPKPKPASGKSEKSE